MSCKSLPSIEIDCRLPAMGWGLAAGALSVSITVPWLVWPGTGAILAVVAGITLVISSVHRAGWLGVRALRGAVWAADGRWWLIDAQGKHLPASLAYGCRVLPAWLWLIWSTPTGRRYALVARAGSEPARRLAVRLRLQNTVTTADSGDDRL